MIPGAEPAPPQFMTPYRAPSVPTTRFLCGDAIQVAVRAFRQPARRISAVWIGRGAIPVSKCVEQRDCALGRELEHGASAATNTPASIIATIMSCAIQIAIGRLQQRRNRIIAVRVVPGDGKAEELGDRHGTLS